MLLPYKTFQEGRLQCMVVNMNRPFGVCGQHLALSL